MRIDRQKARELFEAFLDLLEEVEVPSAEPSRSRAKAPRRAPTITRPAGDSDTIVAGQASRILRSRGLR